MIDSKGSRREKSAKAASATKNITRYSIGTRVPSNEKADRIARSALAPRSFGYIKSK